MSAAKPASTSHAHNIEPLKEGKLAESSKTLTDHYARAKAAQLQKQAQAKEQPANMSFAKTIETDGRETKLDAVSKDMRSQYERAKAAQMEKAPGETKDMKAPAPVPQMHLRPGGNLQRQVDGPIHRKELSDYDKQVKAKVLSESAKARAANQNEQGKDHDRGR